MAKSDEPADDREPHGELWVDRWILPPLREPALLPVVLVVVIDAPVPSDPLMLDDQLTFPEMVPSSASVAVAVNDRSAFSLTVLFPMAARTGATFTSLTVTLISSLSESEPSDTAIVIG